VWVTGTIGDGALGLLAAKGEFEDAFLADRYRLPRPRMALGLRMYGIADAAMDISDGLVQDLGHICRASGLAADIEAALVPLSASGRAANRLTLCLTGGDDYELLLAVPPAQDADLLAAARAVGIPVTRIGTFRAGDPRVTVWREGGSMLPLDRGGWSHFA
jgi:thiamine-monophosphate kinase